MRQNESTIIVGGGVSGLCIAHRLIAQEPGADVCVLEASDCAGGHIRTDVVDGYLCDRGPNGFLDREPRMLEWIEQLGLSSKLVAANEAAARRFLLLDDRLVELVAPPRFLVAPLLSLAGRVRLLCEPLIKARRDGPPESVWNFAARRIGPEAADTLVSAMVLGIYGGDAKSLSLEHCFPRMAAMEREHGGLFKAMLASRRGGASGGPMGPGGVLTTFEGGIGTLVEQAVEALGASIRTNAPVAAIEAEHGGFSIRLEGGEALQASRVVVAAPAFAAANVVRTLDQELGTALSRIEYAPIVVVCSGFRREQVSHDLKGFGYLVPPNQGKQVLGCIWTSSLFPRFAPEGRVLLRTMIGGALRPEAADLSDAEILDLVDREVHCLLGVSGDPEIVQIYRHPRGIPQYGLHHSEVLAEIAAAEERHPGLYLTGNGYRGIGMNDCVAAAYTLVERMNRDRSMASSSRTEAL